MSQPHFWTEYQKDARSWDRFAYWTKAVLAALALLVGLWLYLVVLFA